MEASRVTIEQHQPERRRRAVATMYCGCCCCCCCCLHTLGSLVGAAAAPAFGRGSRMPMTYYFDEETGTKVPLAKNPGFSAVTVFWWVLCLLIFLGAVISIVTTQSGIIGIIILLVVLPLLQLASAFITLVVFACWRRHDKAYQLKQLAKITGGIVLGSVLGIVAMLGIAAMFEVFS